MAVEGMGSKEVLRVGTALTTLLPAVGMGTLPPLLPGGMGPLPLPAGLALGEACIAASRM